MTVLTQFGLLVRAVGCLPTMWIVNYLQRQAIHSYQQSTQSTVNTIISRLNLGTQLSDDIVNQLYQAILSLCYIDCNIYFKKIG